jgi:hypothetical protein
MFKKSMFGLLLVACLPVVAHPGSVDIHGCHNDHVRGGYHCYGVGDRAVGAGRAEPVPDLLTGAMGRPKPAVAPPAAVPPVAPRPAAVVPRVYVPPVLPPCTPAMDWSEAEQARFKVQADADTQCGCRRPGVCRARSGAGQLRHAQPLT